MTVRHASTTAEFRTAWAASTFGDVIELEAGTSFESPANEQIIKFEDKGAGTDYIIITTDGAIPQTLVDVTWPNSCVSENYHRMTVAEAVDMPKLISIGNQAVISFNDEAHHIKFIGVEFTEDGTKNNPALISNGDDTGLTPRIYPHHITFESCYAHPFGEDGTFSRYGVDLHQSGESAFILNGSDNTWDRCAIQGWAGLKLDNDEKQNAAPILAIVFDNCSVEHCLLEGAGPIFVGGGGELNPDNITTGSNWTYTSATIADITHLLVGDLIAVNSQGVNDNHLTPIYSFPEDKFDNPATIEDKYGPYCNGRIETITPTTGTAGNVTFTNLTAGVSYHKQDLFLFGATSGQFKITFMGSESTALNFNYTKAELETALLTCSTLDPGDFVVNTFADDGYAYAPTNINFIGQWAYPTPINPPTVTSSTLAGGSIVAPAGFFAAQQESYINLMDSENGLISDKPSDGAQVFWRGFQAHDSSFQNNLIAHPLEGDVGGGWPPEIVGIKGFIELKGIENAFFNGNVFIGEPTGFVITVRSQGGVTPWANVNGLIITNNLWIRTNNPFPLILADGAYQTEESSDILIDNNLFLKGHPPDEIGHGSGENGLVLFQNGDSVTFTHNTAFMGGRVFISYASPNAVTNVIVRDNIIRPYGLLAFSIDGPDGFSGFTADHNLIINNKGLNSGFIDAWYDELGVGAGWTENSLEAVPFVALSPNFDPPDDGPADQSQCDIFMNPRLGDSSLYKAGGTREASDGEDVGCNIPALIVALGYDPFTGEPVAGHAVEISGAVTFTGIVILV